MRALHFMKVDYIMTRKQLYLVPIFLVLSVVITRGMRVGGLSLLVACAYMIFVASVFSTAPFCEGKSRGFLLLFPATTADRVAGRFLYGLSFVSLLTLFCGVLAGVYRMMGIEIARWILAVILCEVAVAILIVTLEFLFFYLFGEGKENWQYLSNFVRVVPGMTMFFIMSHMVGDVRDAAAAGAVADPEAFAGTLMRAGEIGIAAALLFMAAAAAVCVKVIEKRDYA